jgi:lipid II:glycine glycyltransferase (peptidoglycan interpeptide bridge formation enzyme)
MQQQSYPSGLDLDRYFVALQQQQAQIAQQQQSYLTALIQNAARQDESTLRQWLHNANAELRFGAAYVAGEKGLQVSPRLIALLGDSDAYVQQAARRSLVLLANGVMETPGESASMAGDRVKTLLKFGPKPTTSKKAIQTATQKWQDWWEENGPHQTKLANNNSPR